MSDNQSLENKIREVLAKIKDPETGRNLSKQIHEVNVGDDQVSVKVGLTSFAAPLKEDFQRDVNAALQAALPSETRNISVEITNHDRPAQPLGQVGITAKAVIAIAAGKGGVGKSTAATSLAIALKRSGCKVGLLDADVYGPSIPHLTGTRGQVTKVDNKIQPLDFDGIPLMSIGFMIPPGEAVIWRGPMLHSAVTTFVRDTAWGDLDYLIIDMPPGTGDIALTLSQALPLTGAVVVCTPQDVALLDAVKAIAMFRQVQIPILGVVENMSGFICPDCGKRYDIFGSGGARTKAEELEVPFLGEAPINMAIRQQCDAGDLTALFEDHTVSAPLEKISYNLARHLAHLAKQSPPKPSLPVL
jgi:ATP-binding protein involved in chromosome partitioning